MVELAEEVVAPGGVHDAYEDEIHEDEDDVCGVVFRRLSATGALRVEDAYDPVRVVEEHPEDGRDAPHEVGAEHGTQPQYRHQI